MIQPASNNDDTPALMSRSDVRRIEQALRNRWELPQRLFEALPAAMMKLDRKSTRLNSSHVKRSRMPSSA